MTTLIAVKVIDRERSIEQEVRFFGTIPAIGEQIDLTDSDFHSLVEVYNIVHTPYKRKEDYMHITPPRMYVRIV